MTTSSDNYRLLTDYYDAWGTGGVEGIKAIAKFNTEDKKTYIAGNSELSGDLNSSEDSESHLHRLLELTEGRVELVGRPQIILAGDTFVAVIFNERHNRVGKAEIVVPRLCIYEITDGKISKSYLWQTDSKAYDEYYPR